MVAEDYGKHEQGLSSYAVALIKTNLSKEISLKSLKGRKSCHPVAGGTIGWTAPVGLLIENGAMQWKECNPYKSAGEYFQQSCVPGLWFIWIFDGEGEIAWLLRDYSQAARRERDVLFSRWKVIFSALWLHKDVVIPDASDKAAKWPWDGKKANMAIDASRQGPC